MSETDQHSLLTHLAEMAPGTPLRDGFERILRGRTGALVVLGLTAEVAALCTGGFELDVPYTSTALRELAKMDGALVLDSSRSRILRAGVHLMPDPSIDTVETGTRHRTADRVARQTGVPVVSVSASMSVLTLYVGGHRHLVERSADILSRADQALQTLERYRNRLSQVVQRLSALEVEDQVTIRDLALVGQRLEMIRRLDLELESYVAELGTDGRLLALQLRELGIGTTELRELIEMDYRPESATDFGFTGLERLNTAELLEPLNVARGIGFSNEHLDNKLIARGYRQLAQINRLPPSFGGRLIEQFGSLQALFAASTAELQMVDGVGESRARIIRDGLTRLAEAAYSET